MLMKSYSGQATFGLLPQPERNPASVITSTVINGMILITILYVGAMARQTISQHRYEETMLILSAKEPPPTPKVKISPPPPPKLPRVKFEAPKINLPKPEPKPELKPIQMEAKLSAPAIKAGRPAVILAPQPKSALAAAAMPAQDSHVKLSTAPVHFGQTFGVTPNPNASRPATVAAIGNPYGGMRGPAVAPHGRVGSTGFGNGTRSGSNAGVVGKVASAGIPSAPTVQVAALRTTAEPKSTNLEVLSKPTVQYTSEARQLKVQGDVILRVTFTANGQVVIRGVMHGLGYGLDEEARRVAQQIRFHPATRNGQAVDMTTNITITFQLA